MSPQGAAAAVEVREATTADLDFVRELDVEAGALGIPATRDATAEEVRQLAWASYTEIESVRALRDRFVTLLAEERLDGGTRPLGFIRLDFASVEPSTGEAQCFIDQLAVAREHWGRGVTHELIECAARMAAARGLKYLVGVVSVNNTRTLGIALGALGFEVERQQIVKRCGPAPARPG